KYWKDRGRKLYDEWKPRLKVSGEVKQTAATVMEDAKTDDDKLQRLFHYCRASIKNINDAGSGLSAEKRNSAKENKVPADTIKQGMGTGTDINLLFAALATAAGFDARMAWVADRSKFFFTPKTPTGWFLRASEVAVQVDGKWKFFDPASTYVPYGRLRWQEENTAALITDPKDPEFVVTPIAAPESSRRERTGRFTLKGDGELEGDIVIQDTGHEAVDRRRSYQGEEAGKREQNFIDSWKHQLGESEITNVKFDNLIDPDKPLIVSFHLKLPGYAQRTGKRMFMQASFFTKNLQTMFPAGERRYPVYFAYPWSEKDHVEIGIPDGYDFDSPDMPSGLTLGDTGYWRAKAGINRSTHTLIYDREFAFGGGGKLLYPVESYPTMKKVFDAIAKSDEHAFSLKLATAAVPTGTGR
ncbi:MAG: hypothetical protein JO022_13315, partial [Acidobacteriaceae bacterium]|nr:hypothetical protein [Acidobacteriaceae bacterium]